MRRNCEKYRFCFHFQPSNVLFTESDKLKVCDIGITREGTGNEKIQEFDTILYMSPEQVRQILSLSIENIFFFQICSKAADVFSLGLIFTELCEVMSNNMRFEVIFSCFLLFFSIIEYDH